MASKGQITYKTYLYPEQSEVMEALRESEAIPTARLFRECFLHVMDDPDTLKKVIDRCREKSYRKTGANIGVWKEYIRKVHAKKKTG